MRSGTAFVALLAATGSLASPLKVRDPKEVTVYDFETVVDVVTVFATPEPVPATPKENVIVTLPPVVQAVTVTVQATPEPQTMQPSQPAPPVTPSTVTEIVHPTVTVQAQAVNSPAPGSASTPQPVAQPVDTQPAAAPMAAAEPSTSAVPTPVTVAAPVDTFAKIAQPQTTTTQEPAPSNNDDTAQQPLPTMSIDFNLDSNSDTYRQLVLYSHNIHRVNHTGTQPLIYNNTLQYYAREKAQSCIWDEDLPADADAAGVGMNMAEGTYIGAANITTIISDMWYNGEIGIFPGYNEANPDMSKFDLWGHFTQVIWKDTTNVGCWSAPCARHDGTANQIGSGFFTVCMYYPAANYPGEYAAQVGTPMGKSVVVGV